VVFSSFFGGQCIALAGCGQIEIEAALPVSVDDQERYAPSLAFEALSIHIGVGRGRNLRIEHSRAHQIAPQ